MKPEKVNIIEKLSLFSEYWSPKIVGRLNRQEVKLAKLKGEFVWHKHDKEDEMFLVLKGRLKIEFRHETIELTENEFLVVPKGVEHKPVADEEVAVMLFEPEDQKDMYQEVLVNIWKSLDSFRGDSAMSTWIYRVAVNTSLTYTGKAYRHMKLMVNGETQNLNSVLDEENLKEKLEQENQLEQLQTELNRLSVIDKALISLMLEGLTMKEIADVIGITEPNVKVKIHRVKAQLKEKLKGENNGNK